MSSTEPRAQDARRRAPRWWAELPLIALVYAAYSAGRLLIAGRTQAAVEHAESILRWERIAHLDPEHALNSLFTHASWLGVPACFCYATLHYLVTPGILVWLWRRHRTHYLFMRTWLMVSTLIGLVGFTVLPTAPPRLLPPGAGFHDTLAQYASYGWWGADASAPQGMGQMTNQYAAMPSLHVGWALWCGLVLWRHARSPVVRVAAVAYPMTIALVVLGTANHYLADAVAGALVMGLGLLLTRPARRLADRVHARSFRTPAAEATREAGPTGTRVPAGTAPAVLASVPEPRAAEPAAEERATAGPAVPRTPPAPPGPVAAESVAPEAVASEAVAAEPAASESVAGRQAVVKPVTVGKPAAARAGGQGVPRGGPRSAASGSFPRRSASGARPRHG